MKGVLTRLGSNNNNLRTNKIEGVFDNPPEVGKIFEMFGESLTPGLAYRYIGTSPVTKVIKSEKIKDMIIFNTQNSLYELEIENTIAS